MNARRLRHRTARRYLGATDFDGAPMDLRMAERYLARLSRMRRRDSRRTPRPLSRLRIRPLSNAEVASLRQLWGEFDGAMVPMVRIPACAPTSPMRHSLPT